MRTLILGGTTEGNALARALAGSEVVTSLAGRTGHIPILPGQVRVGGFGGVDGLAEYLKGESIGAVIDATHPFAARMAANAAEACERLAVPRLKLLRPEWKSEAGDRWVEAGDMEEAARLLPGLGRRAFLTVGIQELGAFVAVPDLLVRLLSPTPLPDTWRIITGRPPFTLADEIALMRNHAIDVLVAKHSGGEATYAKIAAARTLGLPVLMIRRPKPPAGPVAAGVDEAVSWLDRR